MHKNDIDYKVCSKCDAPLPNSKGRLDYFNLDKTSVTIVIRY